jgi:hypothetical protein
MRLLPWMAIALFRCPVSQDSDSATCDLPDCGTCIDSDDDGVCDDADNCPDTPNEPQDDSDGDGVGDLCDACHGAEGQPDTDQDGICDDSDLCPATPDPDLATATADADLDGLGDGCDLCLGANDSGDPDADGVCADRDNCPQAANPLQDDRDDDGLGVPCDPCAGDQSSGDTDNDRLCDDAEFAGGTDPADPDSDDDRLPDGDEDVSGNGVLDSDETDPLDPDTDDDGTCDGWLFDAEGDGLDVPDSCVSVIRVDPAAPPGGHGASWQSPYSAIADAVSDLPTPGEIWLRSGLYTDPAHQGWRLDRPIAVRGGFAGFERYPDERTVPRSRSTLTGDSNGDGVGDFGPLLRISADVTLDGLELAYGRATDPPEGGAVQSRDANLSLIDVLLSANQAFGDEPRGGAVVARGGSLRAERTRFSHNIARCDEGDGEGGAIAAVEADVVLFESVFDNNAVECDLWMGQLARGGAISQSGGSLIVDQSAFSSNETLGFSEARGGAVWLDGASFEGSELRFEGNLSEPGWGAAIATGTCYSSCREDPRVVPSFELHGSRFLGNRAQRLTVHLIASGHVELSDVTFRGNVGQTEPVLRVDAESLIAEDLVVEGNHGVGADFVDGMVTLSAQDWSEVRGLQVLGNSLVSTEEWTQSGFLTLSARHGVYEDVVARRNQVANPRGASAYTVRLNMGFEAHRIIVANNHNSLGLELTSNSGSEIVDGVIAFNSGDPPPNEGAYRTAGIVAEEPVRLERVTLHGNHTSRVLTGPITFVDGLIAENGSGWPRASGGDVSAIWASTLAGGALPSAVEFGNTVVWPLTNEPLEPLNAIGPVCAPAWPGFEPTVALSESPFDVSDPDGDGVASYFLRPDSPCVDAGQANTPLQPRRDHQSATTAASGTSDTGAPDLGVHYPLLGLPSP